MAWTPDDEIQLRLHLAEAERMEKRTSLLSYTLATFPEYQVGAIHRELAEALEWFSDEVRHHRAPRLIIEAPPRAGKSFLSTERFGGFHLGRNPHHRIIQASHTYGLASGFSRSVLRQVQSREYREIFPETVHMRGGEREWETTMMGGWRPAGVGVGISGMGADALLVDDPFKDWREAMSPRYRDRIGDWYFSTSRARLAPGGGVMIVATRWHPDDLTGRVKDAAKRAGTPDRWRVVSFPAIAMVDDHYRKAGESFDAKRFPLDGPGGLLEIKGDTPSMVWASLYQQQPTNAEGTVFLRKWGLRRHAPGGIDAEFPTPDTNAFDVVVATWDMAFKKTDTSDFVVGQVWGKKGPWYFLLDQVRARMNFPDTVQAVRMMVAKWPQAQGILVEAKANGDAVVDQLRSEIEGLILVEPKGGKEARASAVSFLFESQNIVVPTRNYQPWIEPWETELYGFPRVDHDDQVDATTQGLSWLRERSGEGFWFLG